MRVVIWPCDVPASLDEDGVVQVENYILDDVSIAPLRYFPRS